MKKLIGIVVMLVILLLSCQCQAQVQPQKEWQYVKERQKTGNIYYKINDKGEKVFCGEEDYLDNSSTVGSSRYNIPLDEKRIDRTDLVVAKLIIGKSFYEIYNILTSENIEYYWTSEDEENLTLYITNGNSVRLWEIKHRIDKNNLIVEIFIRYRHSNLNDLRDFYKYDLPSNTKHIKYEKSLGSKLSHFRLVKIYR
jgi:hypothetical protein